MSKEKTMLFLKSFMEWMLIDHAEHDSLSPNIQKCESDVSGLP